MIRVTHDEPESLTVVIDHHTGLVFHSEAEGESIASVE